MSEPIADTSKTHAGRLGSHRRMFYVGCVCFAAWAAILISWGVLEPKPYAQGWRLVLELAFFGRLVSVAEGMSMGCSRLYLLVQNIPQDMIVLLICYPVIIGAYERGLRDNFVGRGIEKLRKAAERDRKWVEPFGVIGLWIFVFFPFWSTGTLIGGLVGYLIGMRTSVVLATVFLGHVVSVFSLIWFFDALYGWAENFNEGMTRFIAWGVIALIVLGAILRRMVKLVRPEH